MLAFNKFANDKGKGKKQQVNPALAAAGGALCAIKTLFYKR